MSLEAYHAVWVTGILSTWLPDYWFDAAGRRLVRTAVRITRRYRNSTTGQKNANPDAPAPFWYNRRNTRHGKIPPT